MLERVEIIAVPDATTYGLNRPNYPSNQIPTFPRLENLAISSLESVDGCHSLFVSQVGVVFVPRVVHFLTSLVRFRGDSLAPTVRTFLAVAGEAILSGSPPEPSSFTP